MVVPMNLRRLAVITLSLCTAVVLGYAIGAGRVREIILIGLAVGALVAMRDLRVIFAIALLAYFGDLSLPILPAKLSFSSTLFMCFIPLIPVCYVMRRGDAPFDAPAIVWLMLFTWLLMLGFVRGWGMLALGSEQIGGASYFIFFGCIAAYFTGMLVTLPESWLRRVLLLALGLILLPMIAEVAHSYLGSLGALKGFVRAESPETFLNAYQLQPVYRWSSFGRAAILLTVLVGALVSTRLLLREKIVLGLPFLLLVFVLAAFSGSREMFLMLSLMVAGMLWIDRALSPVHLIAGGVVGITIVAVLVLFFVDDLPYAMQRVFAAVPGADVSREATLNTNATLEWRKHLWAHALEEVPRYLWLGRGFGFHLDWVTIQEGDSLRWNSLSGDYHNGVLDLLVKTGLPGTLLFYGGMGLALYKHLRLTGAEWCSSFLKRAHRILLLWFGVQLFSFTFVYGDMNRTLIALFMALALLEACWASERRESEVQQQSVA